MKSLLETVKEIDEAAVLPIHDTKYLAKQFVKTIDRYNDEEVHDFVYSFLTQITNANRDKAVCDAIQNYVDENL